MKYNHNKMKNIVKFLKIKQLLKIIEQLKVK